MPITVTCVCHNGITETFDSAEEAVNAGWRLVSGERWASPRAMEHGFICPDCGDYIDFEQDGYTFVENENIDLCENCFSERGGFYCEHCEHDYVEDGTSDNERQEVKVYLNGEYDHQEIWCGCCANEEAEWNEEDEIYEIHRWTDRRNRFDIDSSNINYEPEGIKPEVCPACLDNCLQKGVCEKCLKNQAYNKQLRETTLWVYDTRFMESGFYHPSEHKKFKSTPYRKKNEHPFLYYGIEVEVGFDRHKTTKSLSQIAKEFIEITHGMFVAESDSSIGYGIEFISRPISYLMWVHPVTIDLMNKGFQYLKDNGAFLIQPETNGIHIHMSRKFFEKNTTKNVDKINKDLDWVFQYFQPEIEEISQRKYTRYCEPKIEIAKRNIDQFRYTTRGLNSKIKVDIEIGQSPLQDGREWHHSVVTMRENTVEVRCFKSSVDVDTIISYIELVRNIAHTVRNKDIKKMTFKDIVSSKNSPRLDVTLYKLEHLKKIDFNRIVKNKIKNTTVIL